MRTAWGLLIIVAGLLHSLYYISGFSRGWETDLWSYLQIAAGFVSAGMGWWIIAWRRRLLGRRGRILLRAGLLALGLGMALVVTTVGFIWSEGNRSEPEQSDYLLILGARVHGETVSLSLMERLEAGLDYLGEYPDTRVILSGGQGKGEHISEAEAMRRYLAARGIPEERMILENRSTNTFENMVFSRQRLEEDGIDPQSVSITLVTSDFHMLRAKLLAKRAGLNVSGLPAHTPEYTIPKAYTRELAALFKSFVFDR